MPLSLAPDAPVDLQLHSTHSDGAWTVEQLLDYVAGEGFALVAVTDHDRPDTAPEVQCLAARRGIGAPAAAEMSAHWEGEPVDALCYGFDPTRRALEAAAEATRHAEREHVEAVHVRLLRDGYHFPQAGEILAASGGEPRVFTDLVALLRGHGHGDNLRTILTGAGLRWSALSVDLAAVVEAAHADGGVCLIAHPGRGAPYALFDAPRLDRLRVALPIDGLEVYHPSHAPALAAAYLSYARAHRLLVSTGSDSHGTPEQMPVKYRAEISRRLLERLGVRVQ